MIDELLDNANPDARFLLDGQTVVLEDYLDVRPERASELAAALRDGRLEAGPWFVLPDELIPGGEGLVRNLLAGLRSMRALRAESPPVLYCPDSFGHPAALPAVAAGFGKELVIVWRGRQGDADTFRWTFGVHTVSAYHLSRSGYELGANLPTDAAAARERWARIHEQLSARATTGVALLLNGADHHARQRDLRQALDTMRAAAAPDELRLSTLTGFSRGLLARPVGTVEHRGELRDSYGYTWTLQGTLASRTNQKRDYARCERDLVRDAEPWLAMVRLRGAPGRRHLTRAAWRSLLLCQPHDSLCGCSIDAVARAVSVRLESAESQATGLRTDAITTLVGHDAEAARTGLPSAWRPAVLVRNRSPRKRSGIAFIDIVERVADVPVGLGSAIGGASPRAIRPFGKSPFGQVLASTVEYERTESPRAYPDNDAVRRTRVATWLVDVPAFGIRCRPLDPNGVDEPPTLVPAVSVVGRRMSNGLLTLRWDARGNVTLEQPHTKRAVPGLLSWESREDRGDLYTPSIRGKVVKARHVVSRVVHRGPLRATLEQAWEVRRGRERIDATVRFSLDSAAAFVRVDFAGDNRATNHRLRVVFKTDVKGGVTIADAAFGPVQRSAPQVDARAARMERPVLTAPLHRYVSRFDKASGATLFSDGLAEYEALDDAIAVTLVRAVGELSRNNMPERPGHAGWPAATPDAQCQGRFGASFAFMLHASLSDAMTDEIERAADDVLVPLVGETLRSALRVPDDALGPELEGAGLAFSTAKESEDGDWVVLRCVNLLERDVSGAWRVPGLREARRSRLDETPGEPLAVRDGRVAFTAQGRDIVTILAR